MLNSSRRITQLGCNHLYEVDEGQDNDTLEYNSVQIMEELSNLCSDRDHVLTPESLSHISSRFSAEFVKLTPEIPPNENKSKKSEDRASKDAIRRQRVEELTRLFIEGKSDIEIHSVTRAQETEDDSDKESDDKESADQSDSHEALDSNDPATKIALTHRNLLRDKVDPRVFNPMLLSIREKEPLLYGAILCNSLISGQDDIKKEKKKKKRRKEREKDRRSERTSSMLTPDFSADPLDYEETIMNTARFVAKVIEKGTIQGLLLGTRLVIASLFHIYSSFKDRTEAVKFPLGSHLRVLSGGNPPAIPTILKKNERKEPLESKDFDETTEMEMDSNRDESSSRSSRLDAGEDSESSKTESKGIESLADSELDEEVLMAQAIALSLSTEAGEQDQYPEKKILDEVNRPDSFSGEEMRNLVVFKLDDDDIDVSGLTVAMHLIARVHELCSSYVVSCNTGILPAIPPAHPHPLTFLLIQSLLSYMDQLYMDIMDIKSMKDSCWQLFGSCSILTLFLTLEINLFHADVTGAAYASIGLGQDQQELLNPLPQRLKDLNLKYMRVSEVAESISGYEDPIGVVIRPADDVSITDMQNAIQAYRYKIRDQSLTAWARGVPIYYGTHSERYKLLRSLLNDCSSTPSMRRLRCLQLELLCGRLALPDMVKHFIPPVSCEKSLEHNRINDKTKKKNIGEPLDDARMSEVGIQDSDVLNNASGALIWTPEKVRHSLSSGTLTYGVLYDFLLEKSPKVVVEECTSVSSGQSYDVGSRNFESLCSTYETLWLEEYSQEEEAAEAMKSLPALLDSLLQNIKERRIGELNYEISYRSSILSTPLVPTIDKFRPSFSLNYRVVLLRSLQQKMIEQLGGSHGDDQAPLEFDSTRCAETITLRDGATTAKQHTAKQWGMVMTTTGCAPGSGTHEWTVRMDKCEKGHIFLGVCTRDASVVTYVGGDRQGWGLIGTRALWHNRSKVRGDYGDGFTTGTTVKVRLNTDSGALSFGIDDTDWGVAFDGLTQCGTLYPAVGLYQRDDQVTILPIQTKSQSPADSVPPTLCFRPGLMTSPVLNVLLRYIGIIINDCCSMIEEHGINGQLIQNPLYFALLPHLLSSLCLMKRFSGFSSLFSIWSLPWFIKLSKSLDYVNREKSANSETESNLDKGIEVEVSGEWELKSMAAGSIPAQQYLLHVDQDSKGYMTGKSSGSLSTVTLTGAVRGTNVRFLETWTQGGTCLVQGRLRSDGCSFLGAYEDTKSGTCGSIVGKKVDGVLESSVTDSVESSSLVILEVMASLLVGKYSSSLIVGDSSDYLVEAVETSCTQETVDSTSASNSEDKVQLGIGEASKEEYDDWINGGLLSDGLPLYDVQSHLRSVVERFMDATCDANLEQLSDTSVFGFDWKDSILPKSFSSIVENSKPSCDTILSDLMAGKGEAILIDKWILRFVGESTFSRVGGELMKTARRTVTSAMVWHTGCTNALNEISANISSDSRSLESSDIRPGETLSYIWKASQRVIEWAIRTKGSLGTTYSNMATIVIQKARFLLELEPHISLPSTLPENPHAERIHSEVLMKVSRFIEAPLQVSRLRKAMLSNSTRAFFRTIGLLSMLNLLNNTIPEKQTKQYASSNESTRGLQLSCAVAAAVQWISPALSGKSIDLDPRRRGFLIGSIQRDHSIESSYYLGRITGCGKHLRSDLRTAFESLYSLLASILSRVIWSRDMDLQMVVLQSWGIVIQPDDHAFLSRVGIFRILQIVLDEARSIDYPQFDIAAIRCRGKVPDIPQDCGLAEDMRKKIVQAALKVVHLLAAQVAQGGEDEEGRTRVPSSDSMARIPLTRKPSGPETLGKSVFHMLYSELRNALVELRQLSKLKSSKTSHVASKLEDEPIETNPQEPTDTSKSDMKDAFQYCYQICSLLYSVSGAPICRSHLSSNKWLRLLLALVESGTSQIQRRVLRLLRRVLPSLNPNNIQVRADRSPLLSFDIEIDDDENSLMDSKSDCGSSLIHFFMDIVGSLIPQSYATMLASRLLADEMNSLPENYSAICLSLEYKKTNSMVVEVVGLIRSLLISEAWSSVLNEVLNSAIISIPDKSFYEPPPKISSKIDRDSDVVMETIDTNDLSDINNWQHYTHLYSRGLAALCILGGYIDGLHVGGTAKVLPRSNSSVQDAAFRGARGVLVAYDSNKSTADLLIQGTLNVPGGSLSNSNLDKDSQKQKSLRSNAASLTLTRPVRVSVEDLRAVSEIEVSQDNLSDRLVDTLLNDRLSYFLDETELSIRIHEEEEKNKSSTVDEDEKICSDDAGGSIECQSSGSESDNKRPGLHVDEDDVHVKNIQKEIHKEEKLNRMSLCLHGFRSIAVLLRNTSFAAKFINYSKASASNWLAQLFRIAISKTTTSGLGDISYLEENWLILWSRWYEIRRKSINSMMNTEETSSPKEQESEESAPSAMCQQMMEMGFPREWCEIALTKCRQNVEAAINFCFEHSGDMESLVAQQKASKESSRTTTSGTDMEERRNPLLEQLAEMGFPIQWCKKALSANRNNVDAALTWILSNGEALEAEDRREQEELQEKTSCDSNNNTKQNRIGPNPLRSVSGQASIGDDMIVEGLAGGGFASVGARQCLVTSGKWYYEVKLFTSGCIQIGWADVAFSGASDRGDGVGDGMHSWAYDGWRQQKWHGASSPWGAKWKAGDVVGCAADIDAGILLFTLNGKMASYNMGIAFSGIEFSGGLFPCASFNRRERLQINLGGSPFKFIPPEGFQSILSVIWKDGDPLPSRDINGKEEDLFGEDCLEEYIGEENYVADSRYFSRESHSSLLRATASNLRGISSISHTNTSEVSSLTKEEVYKELENSTRALSILHARRALLTLLASWPVEIVGKFSLTCIVRQHDEGLAAPNLMIDFIKLVCSLNGQISDTSSPTQTSIFMEEYVSVMLDGGSSGKHALFLLSPLIRSCIQEAFEQSGDNISSNILIQTFVSQVESQLNHASKRQYARVPWDGSDASITTSLSQTSNESNSSWTENEAMRHPNIALSEWITILLIEPTLRNISNSSSQSQNMLRLSLFKAWIVCLKSPSMCLKEKSANMLNSILQEILRVESSSNLSAMNKSIISSFLDIIPINRVIKLTKNRLCKEQKHFPVCSKYLQSLIEFSSAIELACSSIGRDISIQDSKSQYFLQSKRCHAMIKQLNHEELLKASEEQQKMNEELQKSMSSEKAESDSKFDDSESMMEIEGSDTSDTLLDTSVLGAPPPPSPPIISSLAMSDEDVNVTPPTRPLLDTHSSKASSVSKTRKESSRTIDLTDYEIPEAVIIHETEGLSKDEIERLEAGCLGIMGDLNTNWYNGPEPGILSDSHGKRWSGVLTQASVGSSQAEDDVPPLEVGSKVTRGPNWKWRDQDGGEGSIGVIEGVSPWSGVVGEGMSVRWPNGSLYTYRWGADGNFDLTHVEVDEDGSITHKYPPPVSKGTEDTVFGCELTIGIIVHLHEVSQVTEESRINVEGYIEYPDYGAMASVVGRKHEDGSIWIQELQLVRGNPDIGWTLRFGSERWQSGTRFSFCPSVPPSVTSKSNAVEDDSRLWGEYKHSVVCKGRLLEVQGCIQMSKEDLFTMDPNHHYSNLQISNEGKTVTCVNTDSRSLALGTVGFTTGVHYWEVHIEQAEFGCVFIGVCEKAGPPGSQAALSARLNRWHGWGFVNFRATYHNGTERIYGDHFNAGDTIGVRLDMNQGKLSFFMDGIKYGEHIVTDLGIAFESLHGDRGIMKTLYPCIGMRKVGDRVSLNNKWVSQPEIPLSRTLSDVMEVSKLFHSWSSASQNNDLTLPLMKQAWKDWCRWSDDRWQRYPIRPRGMLVDFDTSDEACIQVSKIAELSAPFLAGDRVRICSSGGRELDQPEEALILGVYRGHLWYRTETQGNEGSDEGRTWGWYWSVSELKELLLCRRNGKDMTLIENSANIISSDNSETFSLCTEEKQARNSFETFRKLSCSPMWTPEADMQLAEAINSLCTALGLDAPNLRFCDVSLPHEREGSDVKSGKAPVSGVFGRVRTFSVVNRNYFSGQSLQGISGPQLRARCAVLRVLNGKLLNVLPLIQLRLTEDSFQGNAVYSNPSIKCISAKTMYGTSTTHHKIWNCLSTGQRIRSLRRLIFTSTKRSFWEYVMRTTMTTTPLPSDEYEDPREIRVIRINRIQAQPSKLCLLPQPSDRLRRSVFGQLYREMRTWSDSSFRRAYLGKGHGGQRRAFKVKFLGEGVNDYGGPYRAVFEQVVDELQMDDIELTKGEQGLLPLLVPCPNRRSSTGSNQDKFLLNPSCGTSSVANGPMALELYRFLGRLIGTAVRHGLQMGLDLPSLVWRPLSGLSIGRASLEAVDVAAVNSIKLLEYSDTREVQMEHLTFTTFLSDGTEVPLIVNGSNHPVTPQNYEEYIQLVQNTRLKESNQQLQALRDGLSSVLPMELAPLFTPKELEVLICGRPEVDVELLRQCTEYEEVDETTPHVQYFWEVLEEMTNEERTAFLRFVWARTRMPSSAKDFPMNFKIQAAHDQGARTEPDIYLPHAQTCFFSLSLPSYSSKEILRSKLLFAIQNSPNMDADVRLHNAEGWADA